MQALRHRCSDICLSLPFSLLMMAAAMAIVMLRAEVAGVLIFVFLMSLLLVFCDDVTVTTLPFLLTCMFVLKCYDSFSTFIVFAPLAVIPIGALVYHLLMHKAPFRRGESFFGVAAVAIAVTLGGWFTLPFKDYFSPTSLFYIGGLGIGMVGAYFLLKREFQPSDRYSLVERIFALFYIAGYFGVFMMVSYFYLDYELIQEVGIQIQWSNNLSTMMMFFMPAPFYFALTRSRFHILSGFLFYLTIVATMSRGGILMGAIELLLCIAFVMCYDKRLRNILLILLLVGALIVAMNPDFLNVLWQLYQKLTKNTDHILTDEPRYHLILASFRDFLSNPVFGQGIGYTGNQDIYSPVTGAANWYHMMIPQIIGSFGTVGIAAYGYQFFMRIRLIFRKKTVRRMALGLSYAGILLMSQINPGEFCPVPYEMLTVLLFILLELPEKELHRTQKRAFTSLKGLRRHT
ncbi:MAG: O-antigen ligase family protein [Clostridia bacterium]|nr:O-antigen ligase family protein [Clostridia bacterium]